MKKIIILGCTIAGVKCAEQIRASDISCEIKIISCDGKYPAVPERYPDLVAGKINPSDVFYRSAEFYDKNNIELIIDKKITRVNLKKNLLVTEEKEHIGYDVLIISDLPEHRIPDIKGKAKMGAYGFKRLENIEGMIKEMPFLEEFCIESDSIMGLIMAMAFLQKKKDVSLVLSGKGLFSWCLDEDDVVWVTNLFAEKSLRVFSETSITELLGDADIKAVKLASGKVISCQMAVFERTKEDFRILKDSDLIIDNGIKVDGVFKTNIDNVYAISNVCIQDNSLIPNSVVMPYYNSEIQEAQGKIVSNQISGKEISKNNIIKIDKFDHEDISIAVIGETFLDERVSVRKVFDKDSNNLKVFYLKDGVIVGAFLVNSNNDIEKIRHLIQQRAGDPSIGQFLNSDILEGFKKGTEDNSPSIENILSTPSEQADFSNGKNPIN